MSELSDSVAEAIRKRTSSAVFGTYILFWAALHWQGIYTTLFVSEDLIEKKFGLLKNEYIKQYFFGWHGWTSLLGYVLPLFMTLVFVWPLPQFVLIHIYRLEQRHKVQRRKVRLEEEEALLVKKETVAKQTQKTLRAEVAAEKTKKQAAKIDPQLLWKQEFNAFKKSKDYPLFANILRSVYKYAGSTFVQGKFAGAPEFEVSPQSLKMADVGELITISGGDVRLTDKGKYFARLYDRPF